MDQWAPIVENFDTTPNTTVWEGSITTTNGRARAGATNTNRSIYKGEIYYDSYFEIELVTLGTGTLAVGGYLRLNTGANERYSINMDQSNIFIDTVSTGALYSGANTLGTLPGILRGEAQGNNIRAYWKGVLVASVQSVVADTAGQCCLYMFSSVLANNEVSRWEAGPLGPNYYPPNRETSRSSPIVGMR